MNPNDRKQLKRLRESIEYARRKLLPFREKRYDMIRQYVGRNYSDNGAGARVPVNLLEMLINIYQRQLAARSPQVLVTTDKMVLKPEAVSIELLLNQRLKDIHFGRSIRRVVLDALFSIGVMKVGLYERGTLEFDGQTYPLTETYAKPIDLDDWVHDSAARSVEEISFSGHRYRVPMEQIQDNPKIKPEIREKLSADSALRGSVDDLGAERVADIGGDRIGSYNDEFQEYVELWDIWIPGERLIVTMSLDGGDDPLDVIEWDGPEEGPFRILSMAETPHNIMPLSPTMAVLDLHYMANDVFRKLARQAERQKNITGYRGDAADDAERVSKADDGDLFLMNDPGGVNVMNWPGVDGGNLAFFLQIKDLFVYLGGNLDALGGLSPQSDTLGQDELLQANASKRMVDMQDRTVEFTRNVVTDLAWYEMDDPLMDSTLPRELPGFSDMNVMVRLQASRMKGQYLDYNFDIDPYSMQHSSPGEKLQTITNTIANVIVPLVAYSIEAGGPIKLRELVQLIAKYSNTPELNDIVSFAPTTPGITEQMGQSTKPSVTTRTNVRVNRPGATRSGKDDVLSRVLLGAGAQGSEMASLGRGVG